MFSTITPKSFKSTKKHTDWQEPLDKELTVLCNNTWTLVLRPKADNVVGSKWMFRTTYKPDGSLYRHKAHLVARGFTQIPDINFTHTFCPMVKASTIRIVLSLAVINTWPLHQLYITMFSYTTILTRWSNNKRENS